MNIALQIKQLDKAYKQKRSRLFNQLIKTWKYCKYQGCNECIRNNGLVPSTHDFAGSYGPNTKRIGGN